MSLFKRKGRRIATPDDDSQTDASLGEEENSSDSPVIVPVRFGKKSGKQSSLRKSIRADDEADATSQGFKDRSDDDEDDGPAVVRPFLGRSGSTRTKKRIASSTRVSFGGDADGRATDDKTTASTPKRSGFSSLGQRVLETNAFRTSLSGRLPTRLLDPEDDDDRPRYSKEYLEELQSSTPNTPPNPPPIQNDGDEMQLDASELDGAMIVDPHDLGALGLVAPTNAPAAHVLTQTEIQERKERRARLALEQDAIALGSEDDEENGYISLVSGSSKKKKEETRLVREDEDLGEGFDEYVEDGGLFLGRKAEREARRKRKQEMASLIDSAEGAGGDGDGEDNDSDDSEAERRAAYNTAQVRAGMDGLHQREKLAAGKDGASSGGPPAVPKMLPLPDLADCLGRMQRAVQALDDEAAERRRKLAEVGKAKEELLARKAELQAYLDKEAEKYKDRLGGKADASGPLAATQSPLRPPLFGAANEMASARGLESLGGTPVRGTDSDDMA